MNTSTNNTLHNDESVRLDSLQEQLSQLQQRYVQTETHFRNERRRFRAQMGLALVAITGAILLSPTNRAAIAQSTQITLESLNARLKAVENKTRYLSVDTNGNTLFTATNVYVQSGSGSTNGAINGKGNLIVGYNEPTSDVMFPCIRTGSHNLIVGGENNYSSYGGLVAGFRNTLSAPFATISGGGWNIANGWYSSISGGTTNTVSGQGSSISGGGTNVACGDSSSISGGWGNNANGIYSSLSGGGGNTANGWYSSISGGACNIAGGYYASVSGGGSNTASGDSSSISGGNNRHADGMYNWVAGWLFQDQ